MQTGKDIWIEPMVLVQHPCLLGEGPVWDQAHNCIRWLDVLQGIIHSYFPTTRKHSRVQADQMIGAIVPRAKGGFMAAMQKGFADLDIDSGQYTMLVRPEAHHPDIRFNDGKCDPSGRFWAGTLALDEQPGAGALYMLDKDMSCHLKIAGTTISNGMAWNKAGNKFYFIDTPTRQIVCYDYDNDHGTVSNKTVVITVDEADGYPDGMTIDDEDMLWIAHYNGWQVTRRNPANGVVLLRIRLPVAKVTCCAFGGEHLNELYITTASKELSEQEHQGQPLAGSLFVVNNTGCQGFAPFAFSG